MWQYYVLTLWKRDTSVGDANTEPAPTVAAGKVFVESNDGYVYALDAVTGTLQWRTWAGGAAPGMTAAYANGLLYTGSCDGSFYVLNASNGTLAWQASVGACVTTSPVVANGLVYVSANYRVHIFDAGGCGAATCTEVETIGPRPDEPGHPILTNGNLYFAMRDRSTPEAWFLEDYGVP